jgi:SAM-dependent methyltransferase
MLFQLLTGMNLQRRLNTMRTLGPGPTLLGPALYQPVQGSPSGLRKATTRLNQALFERGMTPPWVWSQERCQRYWSTRTSDGADNRPADYVAKDLAIVDLLHEFWSPEVAPSSALLELGCNAGANLERLRQLGYTDLAGIEVNPNAIEALREAFPAVAEEASLTVGSLEDVLPTLGADSVDAVYTMAVLLHLHPASDGVFDHMVRVARSNICVIEAEETTLAYIFARNYRRVFERRGWHEVRSLGITAERFPELAPAYSGYVARLFTAP